MLLLGERAGGTTRAGPLSRGGRPMSPEATCPDCGATVPPDAPTGLCPRCLLLRGFDSGTADPAPGGPPAGLGSANTDRNLLFGVLALQLELIDPGQFAEACSGWS